MDGGLLYEHLTANAANHAYDGVAGIPNGQHDAIDITAERFLAWFDRLILQPPPTGDDAWAPPSLDYRFAASAPAAGGGEKVYVADDYFQGRLDWYSLDVDSSAAALDDGAPAGGLPAQDVRTTIPVAVTFTGMPNTRWWAFEERKTNYGDVDASTTDLAKLLFLEFALVYGNDWFVVPYTLPSGTIAAVCGLAVTNVFGERFWVESADAGADADWQRWSMYTINDVSPEGRAADTSLLLLPTTAKVDQASPEEDVMLIRDEVANMVWGVEATVPLRSGVTAPGIEAARQLRAFFEAALGAAAPPPAASAPIRYQIMSTVPENWIPFIPVHVPDDNREIQLQRAAMPRIIEGDPNPPIKVQPRTVLLRQGLDAVPPATPQPYFVHEEEEVPRAGTRLFHAFQRARWTDGSTVVWLRVRRQTGRGEGSSGLRFDELVDAQWIRPSPRPPAEIVVTVRRVLVIAQGAHASPTQRVAAAVVLVPLVIVLFAVFLLVLAAWVLLTCVTVALATAYTVTRTRRRA
jgi:hypothetical protein